MKKVIFLIWSSLILAVLIAVFIGDYLSGGHNNILLGLTITAVIIIIFFIREIYKCVKQQQSKGGEK